MLKEALLAAALTFRPWHGDVELPQEREERLQLIAQAIVEAVELATCRPPPSAAPSEVTSKAAAPASCQKTWQGDPRELAFLLLAQAYFETHLARHVHEGKCRAQIGECDSGRAISLWQLQAGPHLSKEDWAKLGDDSLWATRQSALYAARSLGRAYNYCRSLRGAIGLYATGQTCNWRPAARREAFVRRLMVSH